MVVFVRLCFLECPVVYNVYSCTKRGIQMVFSANLDKCGFFNLSYSNESVESILFNAAKNYFLDLNE